MSLTGADQPDSGERVLLAFVGKPRDGGGYPRIPYRGPSGQPVDADFGLVATAFDLAKGQPPWTPTKILTVTTQDADRDTRPRLVEALRDLECGLPEPEPSVLLPVGLNEQQIRQAAAQLQAAVPAGAEVVLDVTHAYRHLPMIALAVLSVLRATKGVVVRNVRYASSDTRMDASGYAPILDLTWTLEASEMAYAARTFAESGAGEPIADLLDRLAAGERSGMLPIAKALRQRLTLLNYGLALDAMDGAPLRVDEVQEEWLDGRSPLLAPVVERAVAVLSQLTGALPQERVVPKRDLQLTPPLLERQAAVVNWLLQGGRYPAALTLMREWAVNRILLARGACAPRAWLRLRDGRERADRALGEFLSSRTFVTPAAAELHRLLSRLTQARNKLDHAGHSPDVVGPPEPQQLRADWDALQGLGRSLADEVWRMDAAAAPAVRGAAFVLNFSGHPLAASEGGWAEGLERLDLPLEVGDLSPDALERAVHDLLERIPPGPRDRLRSRDPGATIAIPALGPATFTLLVCLEGLTGGFPTITYPVRAANGYVFVRPIDAEALRDRALLRRSGGG